VFALLGISKGESKSMDFFTVAAQGPAELSEEHTEQLIKK